MTFLNTWAVGFTAIAPVIVLLYLLKLKRRALPVSTTMFWQRVLQENRQRAFFQKLRQLLSLLLHLLIFALLLGALAKPTWDRLVREGASTVVIVDARARMQAQEDGATRFERARQRAAEYLRQADPRRQMALITLDSVPRVGAAFTDDERALREALERVAPTDATGEMEEAVRLAEDLLGSRVGGKQIVVITDRAFTGSAAPGARVPVQTIAVGTSRENVAITRLAARPLLNSPQTSEVLLELQNFGAGVARGNVEVSFDNRLLDVKPFELPPGAKRMEVFPSVPRVSASTRGWLSARIDVADALAADNEAFAILPSPPKRRVLLVSAGNFFLEKLLEADQNVTFELVSEDAYRTGLASKFDVVIFDKTLPADFQLASAPTHVLCLGRTPFDTGGAALEQPLLTDLQSDHPVLRLVNLQNITVVRATALALPPDAEAGRWATPVRSFDHPLLIAGERGGKRIAALGFDIAESDLPLRVAFPLLVSNLVQWLAGEAVTVPRALAVGETLPLAAGERVWTEAQRKFTRELKPDESRMAREFFVPLRAGFYLLQGGKGTQWLAANTFSSAESDLRQAPQPETAVPSLPKLSLASLGGWPPWVYLALGALVLCTVEWWLFHRRRTE